MPKPTDYDKTHLRNMAAIGTRIDRIFKKAAEEAAKIGASIKSPLPEDKIFSFDDYPATQKQIERLMQALKESMEMTIVNGVESAWTLSNNKNNALVARIFGDNATKLPKEQYRRYFSTNGAALDAFLQRKEQGLNLSDRVWRYTNAFKREIELGLDLGIRSGESAAQMTRSLRQYLQYPDKLFRRVRDKHGNLRLSQNAKAFHPGQGVYRSSYKNARRLACTETNIAYRTSDYLRWQQMDFVVGIEIKLSNNHTLNGVHFTDICDKLKGRYPKDFKFVGWHPHCRCHAVSILKTDEEMEEDTQRILAGEKPKKGSVNAVQAPPAAFKDWVEEHSDKIEMGGNLPYFVKDNRKMVDKILGKEQEVKKTPIEIAKERHEARTPEEAMAIQKAWNERRIANIQQTVDNGLLPKEVMEGLTSLPKDQFNDRIAFLQKRAATHAARTPEEIQAIKDEWAAKQQRDKTTRIIADNVLKVAQDWQEVDFSTLQKLIADNNLTKMREEARKVAQAVKTMRDEEKALSDLIPDVHGWHSQFSLSELKEAHGKIQSTLDYWKAKGYDLATDSNLSILKKELEQKIKFVENPGAFKAGLTAHKTWEVQKQAYQELLAKVETRIELIKLEAEYQSLLGFSTTSKEFKNLLSQAKAALDAGDKTKAQFYIHNADLKKNALETARARKSKKNTEGGTPGAVTFKDEDFTKERKDKAMWTTDKKWNRFDPDKADAYFRQFAEKDWERWNDEQKDVIYHYTSGSSYINEPTYTTYYSRKYNFDNSSNGTRDSWKDINTMTDMIDRCIPFDRDIWLNRGGSTGEIMGCFGIDLDDVRNVADKERRSYERKLFKLRDKRVKKYASLTDDEIIGRADRYMDWRISRAVRGTKGTQAAFMSTAHTKGYGFVDDGYEFKGHEGYYREVVLNIYCPKGTKGIYTEPYSAYGALGRSSNRGNGGRAWDGKTNHGYGCNMELEVILQRGGKYRITNAEYRGGKWFIDVELIEQPKKLPNQR